MSDGVARSESEGIGETSERDSQKRQPCAFFLKTGSCAFGNQCKFEHPADQPPTRFNSLGLPLRENEPDCAYYLKNLHCGYGASCKFHHAEPVMGWMPMPVVEGQAAGSLPSGYRVLPPGQMAMPAQPSMPPYSPAQQLQQYNMAMMHQKMMANQYNMGSRYGMTSGVVPQAPSVPATSHQMAMHVPVMLPQAYPIAQQRQAVPYPVAYPARPEPSRAAPPTMSSHRSNEVSPGRQASNPGSSRLQRSSITSGGPSRAVPGKKNFPKTQSTQDQ